VASVGVLLSFALFNSFSIAEADEPVAQGREVVSEVDSPGPVVAPVVPAPMRVITNVHGEVMSKTRLPPYTNAPAPDVWNALSTAVEPPGSSWVTTNADGKVMTHFAMQPVVTNMTALTNALPSVEERQAGLEKEIQSIVKDEMTLRRSAMTDYSTLMNIATNFVPEGAEGKRLMDRIAETEKELKELRTQFMKKLEADPAYAQAKARMEADTAELKTIQTRKTKLREDRNALTVEMIQIKALEKKEESKKVSKDKPKAGAP